MKILVTGGAGFIGSHTVVSLVEAGYTPVILDNFSNSEKKVIDGIEKIIQQKVTWYEGDCCDAELVKKIIKEEEIQGVIHFAASKAVGESMEKPLLYYRNNLLSLIAVLDAMTLSNVPRLIFSSSCTVYGNPEQLPVTENSPVKVAASVYGNTKKVGEEICRDTVSAGNSLKVISLRYFNPIGAHPSGFIGELPLGTPNNLVPFITQAAAGLRSSLTVFGDDYDTPDGSCIRDYIHVMDLAEAHVAALKRLDKITLPLHFDVINVGTGNGNSVLEVVQTFEKVNHIKVNYSIGKRRPGDIEAVYADVTKSVEKLNWKAVRTLEDSLKDAWRWQQNLL